MWESTHNNAFTEVKQALIQPPILTRFDPNKEIALHTDASRLTGLDYVLLQKHENLWKLIQCGSRFYHFLYTETRYSMIEIELLGIVWPVKKCKLYLQGLNKFTIITGHKPLIPILNEYTLDFI